MMKRLFFIGTTITLLAANCKDAIQTPTFVKHQNMKLGSISMSGGSISTDLVFNNPNKFGLQLKETDIKIYLENEYMGDAEQSNAIKINATSDFVLPIIAKFNTAQAFTKVMGLLGKKEVNYEIKGTAKVGKGNLFIKVPINVQDKYIIRK
jgi:LEA14-like dessication related protein